MMYFVPYVKLCMTASRDISISYDLSQLSERSAIAVVLWGTFILLIPLLINCHF
jgi:hypothetical protein